MTRFLRRLRFFVTFVYRPVTGPISDEDAKTWTLATWWSVLMKPSAAWDLAGYLSS